MKASKAVKAPVQKGRRDAQAVSARERVHGNDPNPQTTGGAAQFKSNRQGAKRAPQDQRKAFQALAKDQISAHGSKGKVTPSPGWGG